MRLSLNSNGGKVLASTVVLGAAAAIAGLGTFGTFTSTTSASQDVASGTVKIELGASGAANRLSVAASGLVPGETVQRAVQLNNTGTQDILSPTLTTTATSSSVLDTDATYGLQLTIEKCSAPWTEGGTAPAYTYTCSGTTTTVLATRPVIGSNLALANLSTAAGSTDNLRVTLSFPSGAGDTFQGKSSTVSFRFDATQRAAASR